MCQSILFYCTRKIQKLDRIGAPGGPFELFHPFCHKSSKQLKGDPLVSPSFLCYAKKEQLL